MRIMRSDELHRVDRVRMPAGRQRGFEHGQLICSRVPHEDLSCICAAKDEIWVDRGKCYRQDVRLQDTMSDGREYSYANNLPGSERYTRDARAGAYSKLQLSHLDPVTPAGSCYTMRRPALGTEGQSALL